MNKILLVIFILLAVFSRLTPHPPNFTPILSIALFSGLMFNNKYGFLIPLSIISIIGLININEKWLLVNPPRGLLEL